MIVEKSSALHTLSAASSTKSADTQSLQLVLQRASEIILGKEHQIRMAMTCILARGHLLIEDIPGVGKTTLSHVLASLLGLHYQRIQFTSDLLPADIIGVSIFDRESSTFRFHPGPVFSQVILADEINRASPKAQSALLEAMEEHQVTADGKTMKLPQPFFVIATQNPSHQIGTFSLPESQLDRFLMRIKLGYPDQAAERALLKGEDRRDMIAGIKQLMPVETLFALQQEVPRTFVSDALIDYLQALIAHTRDSARFEMGLSPRAGLALQRAAQAWALIAGRKQVLPEDVQAVIPAVVGHRLRPVTSGPNKIVDAAQELIRNVAIP
ncbi:MAG: MoxR family ATPase [Betaproteobacteria bacterium]|nr:MoxR family ATPase [Betaproteobacteria bacterium]